MRRLQLRSRNAAWLWLAVLAGLALLAVALWPPAPKLPVYQSRTLYEWIAELDRAADLHPADFAKVAAAQSAIRAIGTNALPFALANLRARVTVYDRGADWLAKHAPFLKHRHKDVIAQRELGIQMLDILGPIAAPCLPELIAGVGDNPGFSEEALLAVGPVALPAYTNLLATSEFPETYVLINALAEALRTGRIRPEESVVVLPCLVVIFHSKDHYAGAGAAEAMGLIHQQPQICVPLLMEGFSDADSYFRRSCMESLGKFGGAASIHAGEIAAAYDSTNASVRQTVCAALGGLRSAAAIAVPVLVRGLQDSDEGTRMNSAQSLGQLASLPEQAVPALEKALQDSSTMIRWQSAQSLGQFGPLATNAIPFLEQSCSDAEELVRYASSNALRAIRQEPAKIIPMPGSP